MKIKFKQRWSISTKRTITSDLKSKKLKLPTHVALEIQVLVWDRNDNVSGLNRLMGPPITTITYIIL
jgi:hypothetical protein